MQSVGFIWKGMYKGNNLIKGKHFFPEIAKGFLNWELASYKIE
jgi:hypothetical protein